MINDALRLIRVYHNQKQGDLAEKLGLSQSHLSEIEKGRKQPTLELLQKYSDVFNLPLSSIMFFAEKTQSGKPSAGVSSTVAAKVLQMLSWVEMITDDQRKTNNA